MNIEWIFFDNDGVLVDTEQVFYEANVEALKAVFPNRGFHYSPEKFIEYSLRSNAGIQYFLRERNVSETQIVEFRRSRSEIYEAFVTTKNPVIKGASEVVKKSAEKYRLGLVTSAWPEGLRAAHHQTDMLRYFEFKVTRDDVVNSKPDPACYLLALEKAKISAEKVVVVEDSPRGIAAAKAAGIFTIAIKSEMTKDLNISAADAILERIGELPKFLKKLQNEQST